MLRMIDRIVCSTIDYNLRVSGECFCKLLFINDLTDHVEAFCHVPICINDALGRDVM